MFFLTALIQVALDRRPLQTAKESAVTRLQDDLIGIIKRKSHNRRTGFLANQLQYLLWKRTDVLYSAHAVRAAIPKLSE